MKRILLFVLLCLFSSKSFCVQKGSSTAVSVESHAVFPAIDGDNELLEFGFFKNGFSLENASTNVTHSSIFPVSGNVQMRGGSISLQNSLFFGPGTILGSSGTFNGGSSMPIVDFAVTVTGLPSNQTTVFKDVQVSICSEFEIAGDVRFEGKCRLIGNHSVLKLGESAHIVVANNSSLEVEGIKLLGLKNSNVEMLTDTADISFDNCALILSNDFTCSHGSINFQKEVTVMGNYKFIYATPMTSTISNQSFLIFDRASTFSYDPPVARKDLIEFADKTSLLCLFNSTLYTTHTGMVLTKGTLLIDDFSYFDMNLQIDDMTSDILSGGIEFGDGVSSENDIHIDFIGNSQIDIMSGRIIYNNVSSDAWSMNRVNSILHLDSGVILALHKDLDLQEGRILKHANAFINKEAGVNLSGSISVFQ